MSNKAKREYHISVDEDVKRAIKSYTASQGVYMSNFANTACTRELLRHGVNTGYNPEKYAVIGAFEVPKVSKEKLLSLINDYFDSFTEKNLQSKVLSDLNILEKNKDNIESEYENGNKKIIDYLVGCGVELTD